jgi:pilus assembly protein CpaB
MGRLRGCLWLTAGLVVALLAGLVGFMTLNKATVQRVGGPAAAPEVQVVAAAHAVPIRSALRAEDVELRAVPVNAAPEGALREVAEAVGKISLVELYPGEAVLQQRLADPNVASKDGKLALALDADKVLMALPAADLMSRAGVLKPGDHVDLLYSLKFPANRGVPGGVNGVAAANSGDKEELATFSLLQNVIISAQVAGKTTDGSQNNAAPEGVLLALSPQDALVLKYMQDAGGTLDLVLRAPGAEQPFEADPVDVDYLINRYRIPTQIGK